jgi:anti-anti-sigma factor
MTMEQGERAEHARKLGSLALRSERDGDTHVIALLGELDVGGAQSLERELLRVEAGDAPAIVIDLGKLEFIDSTGIRLLVMAAERCGDERLSLRRGPKQVHRVFEITDLADRLPFADD